MADPDYSTEIWKPIPGFHGYEASSLGQVRSLDQVSIGRSKSQRPIKGRTLKPQMVRGYLYVTFSYNRRPKRIPISHCVLLAFIGPRKAGTQACHNNGIRTDNRPENLRWDTAKNNTADKLLHGTQQRGSSIVNSKLNEMSVREVRRLVANGTPQTQVAKMFGIRQTNVSMIVHRKTWKHVD